MGGRTRWTRVRCTPGHTDRDVLMCSVRRSRRVESGAETTKAMHVKGKAEISGIQAGVHMASRAVFHNARTQIFGDHLLLMRGC